MEELVDLAVITLLKDGVRPMLLASCFEIVQVVRAFRILAFVDNKELAVLDLLESVVTVGTAKN